MYDITEIMPEDGHFIAIWTYNDKVWTSTFSLIGGNWMRYIPGDDEWELISSPRDYINSELMVNVRYIRVDQDGVL